jgi:hypothetical protein
MMNSWFLNSVLPMTPVEELGQWLDRADSEVTFVFESSTLSIFRVGHKAHLCLSHRYRRMFVLCIMNNEGLGLLLATHVT